MSRKESLRSFALISDQPMSGTGVITSIPSSIQFLDDVGIQLNWSGSPTGSFQVQVSADYNPQTNNAGEWIPIILSYYDGTNVLLTTDLPTSFGSPYFVNASLFAAPYIRVVYTNESGSGSLTAYITAKGL